MTDAPTPAPVQPPTDKHTERLEEARRRLLEPPPQQSFWRTAEFQRVGGLLFLLVVAGIGGALYYWSQITKEEQAAREEAELATQGAPVPPDPALRDQRISTLFQGALADSKNGEDFRESGGYGILLRELANYAPDEVKTKAKRWLDYEGCLKDPDGWRGEFVKHRGLVKALRATRLDTPVMGMKDVWRGYMQEIDGSEKLVFDLIGDPPVVETMYDAWDVEGVFYRTVRYEDNEGKVREMPYLLVRNLHLREVPPSRLGILNHPFVLLMAVVGLALFLARLLLFLSKNRRQAPASAGAEIRRLMKQQQASKHSPPTPPASS